MLAILTLSVLCLVIGYGLAVAAHHLTPTADPVVERINQLLPQTQCAQCGHPGCRPYAQAIADGRADINQCPPGGEGLIRSLSRLLDQEPGVLDPAFGTTKPESVAFIREAECIGCTLCIQACPVDAIIGAARHMHTVLRDECTGCELCLPPCPVDCIDLLPVRRAVPPAP